MPSKSLLLHLKDNKGILCHRSAKNAIADLDSFIKDEGGADAFNFLTEMQEYDGRDKLM